MKVSNLNNNLIIEDFNSFSIREIAYSGQCFRWDEYEDGFLGIVDNKVLKVNQDNERIIIYNCDEKYFNDKLKYYFDLDRDYEEIKNFLSKDSVLKKAIPSCPGIRILNQDFFETLISFIISQNNNIPRIKKIINSLCQNFGEKIESDYGEFYSFPTPERLKDVTVDDLAPIKSGFRAKYIVDAVEKVNNGEIDFEFLKTAPLEDAIAMLEKIKGVGLKVSSCVLLFSASRYDTFPVDVWIKRVMTHFYGEDYDYVNLYGKYPGIAQQYLFVYGRNENIK